MADHMTAMTAEQLREQIANIERYARTKLDEVEDIKAACFALTAVANSLGQLAARLSGMAADAWQPIETAPKRTRVIVGYRNSQGKWRTAMATYFTADDIAEWENDDCAPGWYERSYAHEAENEYVYALEAEPLCWQPRPPEPPHV